MTICQSFSFSLECDDVISNSYFFIIPYFLTTVTLTILDFAGEESYMQYTYLKISSKFLAAGECFLC